MNKNQLKQKIKELLEDMVANNELDEITTSGDVDGYSTPHWGKGKNGNKKNKRISTNSTGYDIVKEALEAKDVELIRKVIKGVINNMFRDIWLKRNSWNRI